MRENDYAARKRRQKLDERYYLLRDWYGAEAASEEMAAHCPEARPIGESLDKVMKQSLSPDVFACFRIQEKWGEIAGEQIAGMTRVSSFNRGVLTVEAAHPLYLRELEMCEDLIRENLNSRMGINCEKIRFVPSSGRRR